MGQLQDYRASIATEITTGGELTAIQDVALRQALVDLILRWDSDDDGSINVSVLQGLTGNNKYVGTNTQGESGVYTFPTLTLTQEEFNSLLSNAGPTVVTVYASQVPLMNTGELQAGTETAQRRVSPELLKAMIDFHATAAGINSFQTFSTPLGTNPAADSSTDTIQFLVDATHGNGLFRITGDSGADSITFAFNVAGLTQETSVDAATDLFLMWDVSAGEFRAVLGENLPGTGGLDINSLTQETTFAPSTDELAVYDVSASTNRKFLYSDIRKWVEVAYSATLTFDRNKTYQSHTQTADITFSVAGSGNVGGTTIKAVVVSNGTNAFNFPSGAVIYGATDGQAIAAGTYEIWFFYNPDGTLSITVPGTDSGSGSPTGNAGGDLSGTYPNPTVAQIQGNAVNAGTPSQGQAMVANASNVYALTNVHIDSTFTTGMTDPGAAGTVTVAYDRFSGISTFRMASFSSAGIGIAFTGMLNNHGVLLVFDAQNTSASINPSSITINGGAISVSFGQGFNWTTGFGTSGQKYALVLEIVDGIGVVEMFPIGNAVV